MTKQNRYDYDEMIALGEGRLFGSDAPQMPLPPMLMCDRITHASTDGGAYDNGQVIAELDIRESLWFFDCHFHGDPVMPGCLGLDAMWQLVGFYLGWTGGKGHGRALSVGKVKFSGQITPKVKTVRYIIDIKKVIRRSLTLGYADGTTEADGEAIYRAEDMRVGLFSAESLDIQSGD